MQPSLATTAAVDQIWLADMTPLNKPTRLVPPPIAVLDASGDWQHVEANVGLSLPADFKQLIEAYGLGLFVDLITQLTPIGPRDLLMRSARGILGSERETDSRAPPLPRHTSTT
jgi:hypothetical protein